ncbi:MAG TPA: hypothetical protein VGC32_07585 [Solirubrobacterales bacterium]
MTLILGRRSRRRPAEDRFGGLDVVMESVSFADNFRKPPLRRDAAGMAAVATFADLSREQARIWSNTTARR